MQQSKDWHSRQAGKEQGRTENQPATRGQDQGRTGKEQDRENRDVLGKKGRTAKEPPKNRAGSGRNRQEGQEWERTGKDWERSEEEASKSTAKAGRNQQERGRTRKEQERNKEGPGELHHATNLLNAAWPLLHPAMHYYVMLSVPERARPGLPHIDLHSVHNLLMIEVQLP